MAEGSRPTPQRFTLDKAHTGAWLRDAIAARPAAADRDNPPGGLKAPEPRRELPEISNQWNPVDPGQKTEVFLLIRRAADAGIIGRPDGADLDFDYAHDEDGGHHHFLIRVGHGLLKLASHAWEMRKLGKRDATGAAAALAILDEAVRSANAVLDDLDHYTAKRDPAPPAAG